MEANSTVQKYTKKRGEARGRKDDEKHAKSTHFD